MVAAGGSYFNAFKPTSSLPTLRVLPGLVAVNDLADPSMQGVALRKAEGISIMETPEASDLGAVTKWVENLIAAPRTTSSKEAILCIREYATN
jgi:hypothetical protein